MKYLLTAVIAASLMACNNNNEETTTSSTPASTETSHDGHSATMTSTQMPALAEVPANAKVFFVNLKDGQTVSSPLKVEMGVEGMAVDSAKAGLKPASGHHHLLIDIDSIPMGTMVPATDSVHHYHFGNAQKTATIKLTPGKHTLVLQFADALHRSFGSRLTSKVTVNVKQ
jgi:hypothetical protein